MTPEYNSSVYIDIRITNKFESVNKSLITNAIIVLSFPDDTYLVRFVSQSLIKDFLCDQIDGVENCLEHCLSLVKFGD